MRAAVCPLHGAAFDVRDGRVLGSPAQVPLATYAGGILGAWFVRVPDWSTASVPPAEQAVLLKRARVTGLFAAAALGRNPDPGDFLPVISVR
jgi:Rieske 2Fe-2S protein